MPHRLAAGEANLVGNPIGQDLFKPDV